MAHILIPTDFSPNALNAALYAMELYGAEGNTFTVLHCYMMPHGSSTTWNMQDRLASESLEDLAILKSALCAKLPAAHYQLEMLSERGYLPEVISVHKDRPNPPDLVVMGTQGATGIEHVLMGTNTADAIKRGGLPVLAVPAHAMFKPLKHIILTDDGGPVDPETTRVLLDLVLRTGAMVVALRMINEDVHVDDEVSSVRSIEAALNEVPLSHVHMSGEDLNRTLDEQIRRCDAEMFAVVHRQRGWVQGLFHRSMAAQLAMHTHIPLLVLQQTNE